MSYRDKNLPVQDRVDDLLHQMTLPEKIAQMGSCWMHELQTCGELDLEKSKQRLKQGIGQITRIGGATIMTAPEIAKAANVLQKIIQEHSRLGIPAIIHEECCSGSLVLGASVFPQMLGLACSFEPELAEKMTCMIRQQLRALGIHQGLAPVLDIGRDPRWGRIEETFGEDPVLISQFGVKYIQGLQGNDLKEGVIATGKHFIGHSYSLGGLNCAPVQLGMRTLMDVNMLPFQAAIRDAKIASIMNSYPEIDGEVVAASRKFLTELLRDQLGFEGLIVSDYEAVSMLKTYHHIVEDFTEAAVKSIQAGIEVELPTNECFTEALIQKVEKGKLEMALVDRAVASHLTKKFELGLFENPYVEEGSFIDLMDGPEQRALAVDLARKSMVLLTNNGILPLAKTVKKLAVIGPNADDPRNMHGDYTYSAMLDLQIFQQPANSAFIELDKAAVEAKMVHTPTMVEALRTKLPQTEIVYSPGCALNSDDVSGIPQAVQAVQSADAVVLVLGDRSGLTLDCTCGETRDNTSAMLPGKQQQLAEAILAVGKPVIVVLISGRPLAIVDLAEKADAILEAWVPGEEGADAIVETLLGENNPGGKLAISFPRNAGQIPVFYNHKPSGSHSNWYHDYVDESVDPLFPFGYGLSYTQFEYSDLKLDKTSVTKDESVKVSCTVKNVGKVRGEEVVQLYVQDEIASLPRPVKELKAFARVSLEPGVSKKITFEISANILAFYDVDLNLIIEPGRIKVYVGSSSEDIRLESEFMIRGSEKMLIEKRLYSCPVQVKE
jgi:beta-glucosidase